VGAVRDQPADVVSAAEGEGWRLMDMRVFLKSWQDELFKIVRDELVRRSARAEWWDPEALEELFEETLLAVYPPDGFDGRKRAQRGEGCG
jgi:hypothetical protein